MNPQIKKIIRKISKKNKIKADNTQNNNANLPKRKFSFFRYSFNKLTTNSLNRSEHRNSVDIAEIQRINNRKSSVLEGKYSIGIVEGTCTDIVNNFKETSVKGSKTNANETNNNEIHVRNHNNSSESSLCVSRLSSLSLPIEKYSESKLQLSKVDEKSNTINSVPKDSNEIIISSNNSDTFKFILRKLFNYPNNFYICLSYIITIFLLISTLYVAYQVEKLESNLVRLIERNHNNLEKSPKNFPDWNKNRQLLISQIERLSQLMKMIQKKLS